MHSRHKRNEYTYLGGRTIVKKLNISKEDYCATVEELLNFVNEQEAASDALEMLTDNFCLCKIGDRLYNHVMNMMEVLTFDKYDENEESTLCWWLFTTQVKERNLKGKTFSVKTPEELYDYLELRHAWCDEDA